MAGLLTTENLADQYLPKDFSTQYNANIHALENDYSLLCEATCSIPLNTLPHLFHPITTLPPSLLLSYVWSIRMQ